MQKWQWTEYSALGTNDRKMLGQTNHKVDRWPGEDCGNPLDMSSIIGRFDNKKIKTRQQRATPCM